MARMYFAEDSDLGHVTGQTVCIVGYGNQGRSQALNMRDSGLSVIVGSRRDESFDAARRDGFQVLPVGEAVALSDITFFLVPDEVMPQVFERDIAPNLEAGNMVVFASGYNIAFGFVEPPPFVDVGMIAPRTIGAAVRSRYQDGSGFYSFVGVGQDATGYTLETLLALAKAMGSLQAGAIEMSMEHESQLDLFVQQAILPAFHHVMTTAAAMLLELGYPPEAVMLDLIISGEFTDYLSRASQMGLLRALRLSSLTGQYGIFSRLHRFKDLKLEGLMEATLDEIRQGDFAIEWSREYEQGYPRLASLLQAQEQQRLYALEQGTLERLK